jgi:hypothetical protein
MNKRFCDCCETELDLSQPKMVFDENGQTKRITAKRYDQLTNKMVEYEMSEVEYSPKAPIIVQLNLNNHDMILREFCKECYKKIQKEVENFWNILYAVDRI